MSANSTWVRQPVTSNTRENAFFSLRSFIAVTAPYIASLFIIEASLALFKGVFIAFNAIMDQEFLKQCFGAVIKSARLRKGISQYALADAAGVGRRFIQGVENGRHEAKISTLFSMALALGVSPKVLIGELEYAILNGNLPQSVLENLPPKVIGRPKKKQSEMH